jgi:hypothetical protein
VVTLRIIGYFFWKSRRDIGYERFSKHEKKQ